MSRHSNQAPTPDNGSSSTDAATDQVIGDVAEALAGSEADDSIGTSPGSDNADAVAVERDHYRDQAMRAVAELDNYRKRVAREAEQMARYQNLPLIRDLLPAIDNLSRTVNAAERTGNLNDLIEGLRMILAQFEQVFGSYSAKPISAVGEPFDPNLHEALQQIPTPDQPPMTVLQEVEKGFVMHERVIRPTKVIVSSAPPQG